MLPKSVAAGLGLAPGPGAVSFLEGDRGVHRLHNKSPDKPALSLHVYAPPLRKMRIYQEDGHVRVHVAKTQCGDQTAERHRGGCISSAGIFDVDAWNAR